MWAFCFGFGRLWNLEYVSSRNLQLIPYVCTDLTARTIEICTVLYRVPYGYSRPSQTKRSRPTARAYHCPLHGTVQGYLFAYAPSGFSEISTTLSLGWVQRPKSIIDPVLPALTAQAKQQIIIDLALCKFSLPKILYKLTVSYTSGLIWRGLFWLRGPNNRKRLWNRAPPHFLVTFLAATVDFFVRGSRSSSRYQNNHHHGLIVYRKNYFCQRKTDQNENQRREW